MDVIGVILSLRKKRLVIFSVYRPPHSAVPENYLLESHLASVMINVDFIICMGDFNVNMLKSFANDICYLNNIIYLFSLKQLIMSPTRVLCVFPLRAPLFLTLLLYPIIFL